MLNELFAILEIEKRYDENIVKEFRKEVIKIDVDAKAIEKMRAANNLFFKFFKKTIVEEKKNPLEYMKLLKANGLTLEEVNEMKVGSIKKEMMSVKDLISQIKSELPQKLMNIYELYAGNIKNRDGVAITVNEYCNSTNQTKKDVEGMFEDAKNILVQKMARRGYEIEGVL